MRYMLSTANHSQPDSYLFLNSRHNRLSEQSVRTVITNLEKQISSPIHITPHMFRHPYVKLKLKISLKIEIPNHQINDNLEFVILLCSIPIIWYEIFINGPPIFTNKMSKRFFF